jgi:NADPH:quinone reductase-like Zn-dependent oxidoreductase
MPSGLTLEELALLPLCGVPAYRAISTFSDEKHTDARALILQAHDGAGAFALQMLKRRGVRVTAHIPPNAPKAAEALVRSLGAEDVRRDEPLHVLDELRAAKARFDFILDTVGGPAIWTAGRALLAAGAQGDDRPEPQFTTLVGDAPDVPVPGARAHWRAGMRALGIRGGEGSVGYAWVSVGADVDLAGEDVRDALDALVEDAEKPTGARPRVDRSSRVLPFERAPELFADGARTLCFGGTAVVKIAD